VIPRPGEPVSPGSSHLAPQPEHVPGLDGLRGIAIIAVLLFHWDLPFAGGGFIGVDLFFVLSGFLITRLLSRELAQLGRIDLRNFYARRALRLLPALLLLCFAYGTWLVLKSDPPAMRHGSRIIRAVLLYYSNWMMALGPRDHEVLAPMTHMWSLSVEEQFYILWPATLTWLGARSAAGLTAGRNRTIVAVLISTIAVVTIWRIHLALSGAWYVRVYVGTDTRIDTLLVGCLLAMVLHGRAAPAPSVLVRWMPWCALLVFAGLAVLEEERSRWTYLVGCSVTAIVSATLVAGAIRSGHAYRRMLEWAPLRWLGRVSYGIYLWHFPLTELARRVGIMPVAGPPNIRGLLALAGATLGCAATSFYLIERPFLRLRHLVRPRIR
jgi:peptidoglycan/LPS O-acetylase OafA/YrhL